MSDHTPTSLLGFGSAGITSLPGLRQALRLLDKAFDCGISHFDTAPLYGQGYSEKIVGAFARGRRHRLTIATKFGLGHGAERRIPVGLALPLNYYKKLLKGGGSPVAQGGQEQPAQPQPYRSITLADVEAGLQGSLRRLSTDYVDYYFIHEGLPGFLSGEAVSFLLDQRKKGTIRYLGIAANSVDLRTLRPGSIAEWDVLQYEGGPFSGTEDIRGMFPDKTHFLHSCLKGLGRFSREGVAEDEKAGFILADRASGNRTGKTIFSTRRTPVLDQNIRGYTKFYK